MHFAVHRFLIYVALLGGPWRLLAGSASLIPSPETRPAASSPNIIIILVDDLGYQDHSLWGDSDIQTPHMETLASRGVLFDHAYVTHPYCGPSRAALMTGRHQARFGMETNPAYSPYDYYHGLPLDENTLASILQKAGYRTGLVGKWHLGASPPYHPQNRGFDVFKGFLSGGHDYYQVKFEASHRRKEQLLYSPIEGEFLPLSDGSGATGFTGYLTDVLTDYAIQFVEDPDARPFFLFLSYNAPHGPLQAPAHFVEKFRDSHNGSRSTYLAMVNALDDNLGRFQKALEKSEKDQNTLIFFLSDNGGVWAKPNHQQETWADNGILRGGKGSFYEGGIRVPMIVSWPETWPAGITFSPMVSSLDIAATAVAAAGLSPDGYDLDGVDLTPFILKQQEGRPHRFLYWRSAYEHAFAIRSEHFKLVRTGRISDPLELYHLGEDPGETDPLQNRNPERVHLLASAWNDWNLHNRNNRSVDAFLYQKKRDAFFREQARALKEQAEQAPLYQISVPEK